MKHFETQKKLLELTLKELKAKNKEKRLKEFQTSPLFWSFIVILIILMYWN